MTAPTCLPWIIALSVTLTFTLIMTVYLFSKAVRFLCHRHTHVNYNAAFIQTDLYIVLYDGRRSTSLHVTTISRPLTELTYTLDTPIHPHYINSCWKPHLTVNWTPLHLGLPSTTPPSITSSPLPLPPIVYIPWLLRFKYHRLFQHLQSCQLVLCNHNTSVALKPAPVSHPDNAALPT